MSLRARKLLLYALVGIFAAQTWLVYSDRAGTVRSLTPVAIEGQSIWRAKNCQSCHQLFGYGGFLGPDLTNAIDELSPERLAAILVHGSGQMPAFELDASEREAIATFLREMDATGVSQPKLGEVLPPAELLRQLSEVSEPVSGEVARGRTLVLEQNCIACHLPNEESAHRSTDLTLISTAVERDRVLAILHDGIPGTAMPRLALPAEDAAAVFAYLEWLSARGDKVRGRFESLATSGELDLSQVPWFEYE